MDSPYKDSSELSDHTDVIGSKEKKHSLTDWLNAAQSPKDVCSSTVKAGGPQVSPHIYNPPLVPYTSQYLASHSVKRVVHVRLYSIGTATRHWVYLHFLKKSRCHHAWNPWFSLSIFVFCKCFASHLIHVPGVNCSDRDRVIRLILHWPIIYSYNMSFSISEVSTACNCKPGTLYTTWQVG